LKLIHLHYPQSQVDNTFGMCGYTCRPIKHGADILVESCTKWIGGHGTTVGGVIVDANTFDWSAKHMVGGKEVNKFPLIADDCAAYHGLNFQNVFGPTGPFKCNMAFIFRARVVALRDMGGCQNPFGAFQLLMGLETLSLRGKAHSDNANQLAAYLEAHEDVAWCSHPSLVNHPSHGLAQKYFRKGTYGIIQFFLGSGHLDNANIPRTRIAIARKTCVIFLLYCCPRRCRD
jgi:O-acetylhomoserine/O-acetylserine sulfhydrylase-like pyridoxal-dependent enzyme